MSALPSNNHADLAAKKRLHAEAEAATAKVKALADLLIAFELKGLTGKAYDEGRAAALGQAEAALQKPLPELQAIVQKHLAGRRTFHWPVELPEVVSRGGLDAFVGNPPFMGGQKITGALGTSYRDYLVEQLAGGSKGSADLCAYFFLRAASLLRDGGQFGMLATNTIAQGDTREVGLDQLTSRGSTILRAIASQPWPGTAALEVAHVWVRRGSWGGNYLLEDKEVKGISPMLVIPGKVVGKPFRLAANDGKSFIGSYVLGMGFILGPEEAKALIEQDPRNKDVLFPYLNGKDLNSRPDLSPSRWVINFHDWPLDRAFAPAGYKGPVAADYPECLAIIEEKVKPERMRNNRKIRRERWWQFAERAPELYSTIKGMETVVVLSLVNNHLGFGMVKSSQVFAHKLAVFPFDSFDQWGLLQSSFHYHWSWELSSTMRCDINYSPSDCFDTFPFVHGSSAIAKVGKACHDYRTQIQLARREGLTATYNRFHSSSEQAADIVKLRALHVDMDHAVAAAYGWNDLDLGHGFHKVKQGIRYTISESARRTVLDRLLALNHERHEEEVRKGVAKKGRTKRSNKRKDNRNTSGSTSGASDGNLDLFKKR